MTSFSIAHESRPDPSFKAIGERVRLAVELASRPPKYGKESALALFGTEMNPEIDALARNRRVMGAFRYVSRADGVKAGNRGRFNAKRAVSEKLDLYESTGNTEHLIDARNYIDLVFERDPHPNKHFAGQDGGHHCAEKK